MVNKTLVLKDAESNKVKLTRVQTNRGLIGIVKQKIAFKINIGSKDYI
jgi:hypothetical protein